MDNPDNLATQGTKDKEKQNLDTICVEHKYTSANTNYVNKT